MTVVPGPQRTRSPWRRRVKRPVRRIPRSSSAESVALYVIIAFKAVKCVTLFAIGLALLTMIGKDLGAVAERVAETLHLDIHRRFIARLIERLANVRKQQVEIGAAAALGYSVVLAIEAIGLWRRRAWAAWLSVVFGSLLLPYEVYEFVEKRKIGILIGFFVNLAIVCYLAIEARRAKHHAA
jgi:uncharacterized membrane protein (DUF2068 family)